MENWCVRPLNSPEYHLAWCTLGQPSAGLRFRKGANTTRHLEKLYQAAARPPHNFKVYTGTNDVWTGVNQPVCSLVRYFIFVVRVMRGLFPSHRLRFLPHYRVRSLSGNTFRQIIIRGSLLFMLCQS